jgi:hypothetical protein
MSIEYEVDLYILQPRRGAGRNNENTTGCHNKMKSHLSCTILRSLMYYISFSVRYAALARVHGRRNVSYDVPSTPRRTVSQHHAPRLAQNVSVLDRLVLKRKTLNRFRVEGCMESRVPRSLLSVVRHLSLLSFLLVLIPPRTLAPQRLIASFAVPRPGPARPSPCRPRARLPLLDPAFASLSGRQAYPYVPPRPVRDVRR